MTHKLSIITATYNAAATLPSLIRDLQAQTCHDFEWVIADGGSGDGTLALLEADIGLATRVSSQSDFGIYDALNRGIRMASGEYYLVVGADDHLCADTVERYLQAIETSAADIISADVIIDGRRYQPEARCRELQGIDACVSSHSVGAVFRKSLHERFGYYSRKLPICADQLFVYQARAAGVRFHHAPFVAGEFTLDGTSGRDALGMIVETCRAKVMSGSPAWLQSLILVLRLLKNQTLIRRQHRR